MSYLRNLSCYQCHFKLTKSLHSFVEFLNHRSCGLAFLYHKLREWFEYKKTVEMPSKSSLVGAVVKPDYQFDWIGSHPGDWMYLGGSRGRHLEMCLWSHAPSSLELHPDVFPNHYQLSSFAPHILLLGVFLLRIQITTN